VTTVATTVANAINSVGSALLITATPSSGSVNLLHDRATSIGNQAISDTVGDPLFTVMGMSGGQGGDCASGIGCASNNDCASGVCSGGSCQ
jgi:hypothetical protein